MPARAHTGVALRMYLWLFRLLTPIAKPHIHRRLKRGKEDPARYTEKFGHASAVRPEGRLIWLHAVGVGEILALTGLIAELHKRQPDTSFLVTSSAKTSAQAFGRNLPPKTIHQFLPLDCPTFINRFLDHWTPDISVWSEQDIWPAMVCETYRRGIPLALINGRMNARSYTGKTRVKGLFANVYNRFSIIRVQDQNTATHFVKLGAEASRIKVSGSLKGGSAALQVDADKLAQFKALIGGRDVWLAASTHEGEEAVAITAHQQILETSPTALLIIAPRDSARGNAILQIAKNAVLQSDTPTITDKTQVYIANSIGEMGLWYSLANSALIGGSMVEIGGHNPYEPAQLDCAVIHGPHIANFALDYEAFHNAKAAVQVDSASDLAKAVLNPQNDVMRGSAKALLKTSNRPVQDYATELLALIDENFHP